MERAYSCRRLMGLTALPVGTEEHECSGRGTLQCLWALQPQEGSPCSVTTVQQRWGD